MSDPREPNTRLRSTRWVAKPGKIGRPPEASKTTARRAARWYHLPNRDRRKPLTITISYRGGNECWYEVHARGSIGRFPGIICLHDVMREIYGDQDHDES